MLVALAQAIFTQVLREAPPDEMSPTSVRGEMRQFQRFNRMIDACFRQHLTVPDYARELGISESRLTEICRRFANQSPKNLFLSACCGKQNASCCSAATALTKYPMRWATKIPPILPASFTAWPAARPASSVTVNRPRCQGEKRYCLSP